jgi:hypothetical protein
MDAIGRIGQINYGRLLAILSFLSREVRECPVELPH